MSVVYLADPAVANYPLPQGGPYSSELEVAKALFAEELASTEGWTDEGIREDVQLYKKLDPEDPYAVPTVKGECLVKDITAAQFNAVITAPGMRRRWDARYENAHVLERYNFTSFTFYSVMKGMGWLVYPRDICGVQGNYYSGTGASEEITIIQTSIVNLEAAPEQSGKTRATLSLSGWQLVPEGNDLKVTYIVKVSLNGSIPSALVSMLAIETPLCTGRARDVFYSTGFAPYIRPSAGVKPEDLKVAFQHEAFSDAGATPEDHGELKYTCAFTTNASGGETFEVAYSTKMYPHGVDVSTDNDKVKLTVVQEEGRVQVDCGTSTGERVALTLTPNLE